MSRSSRKGPRTGPLSVIVLMVIVAGFAVACLPDLNPDLPITKGCGDGVIDLESGEECDPGIAGGIGCRADCKVSCDDGITDPESHHCYLIAKEARSTAEAIGRCRDLGGHVATFGDEREQGLLTPRLPPGSPGYWVALSEDPSSGAYASFVPEEPGWGPLCPGCYGNDGKLEATVLPEGSVSGPCVLGLAGGKVWGKAPCDLSNLPTPPTAFCEREPLGRASKPCDGSVCLMIPWTHKKGKRYVFSVAPLRAEDARLRCVTLGGRLVVFESRQEREELVLELSSVVVSRSFTFWIGLSRPDATPSWVWEDGAPLGTFYPVPWADAEPKAKGPGRAYVSVVSGAYDTQLSHADDADVARPYLCEIR